MADARLHHGDNRSMLSMYEPDCFDACVTDPPYGLGTKPPDMDTVLRAWLDGGDARANDTDFMGRDWELPGPNLWREVYRILKPGAYVACFAGARTVDLMGLSLRLAGFELTSSLWWCYGAGQPHGLDAGKAFLRAGDADAAAQWEGFHTQLKPAVEPILLAQKPMSEPTVIQNLQRWGVGALNIDLTRIPCAPMARPNGAIESPGWGYHGREQDWSSNAGGRFPSNLLLDDAAAAWLDAQSGHSVSSDRVRHNHQSLHSGQGIYGVYGDQNTGGYADEGGASRFFARVGWGEDDIPFRYCTKASKAERHAGCQHLLDRMPDTANDDEDDAGATTAKIGPWPCVKPLAVMRWLVRLTTPPGGTLIDPYAGSGTTLIAALQEKLSCDGIELDDEAALIAHARLAHWSQDHSVAQLTLF